jgi:F-type H+-transporting ATPase subunit c
VVLENNVNLAAMGERWRGVARDLETFAVVAVGAGIGAGIVTLGAARGIGHLAGQAMEGIARQPEAGGRIGTNMIIAAALIEGFTFFALVICLQLAGKIPAPGTP